MDVGGWVSAKELCHLVSPTSPSFDFESLADLALDGFKGGKQRLQLCMSRNNSVDPQEWYIAGVRACQGVSNPHLKDARMYRRLLPEHIP